MLLFSARRNKHSVCFHLRSAVDDNDEDYDDNDDDYNNMSFKSG
jgi:hypothetical protein